MMSYILLNAAFIMTKHIPKRVVTDTQRPALENYILPGQGSALSVNGYKN